MGINFNFKYLIMKKIFIGIFMLTVLATACKKNKDDVRPPEENTTYRDIISSLGFDPNKAVEQDDHYLVEGDIIFTKKELKSLKEQSGEGLQLRLNQTKYKWIVSDTYIGNVKVFIPSTINPSWQTAVRGAINNWNTLTNTKIHFSEVTTSSTANIIVSEINNGNITDVASASMPQQYSATDTRPGSSLIVNNYYLYLGSANLLYTATHELGHSIGFLHSNQQYNASSGSQIPNTPLAGFDPKSVMHQYSQPWEGFTNGDRRAAEALYLKPGAATTPSVVSDQLQILYRYFINGRHYISYSNQEYNGQYLEGPIGKIYKYPVPNTMGIHHLYNTQTGDHLYTIYKSEYKYPFEDRGVIGYAYPNSGEANFVPLHRYFNGIDHYPSRNGNENPSGYVYEGVSFYLLPHEL